MQTKVLGSTIPSFLPERGAPEGFSHTGQGKLFVRSACPDGWGTVHTAYSTGSINEFPNVFQRRYRRGVGP